MFTSPWYYHARLWYNDILITYLYQNISCLYRIRTQQRLCIGVNTSQFSTKKSSPESRVQNCLCVCLTTCKYFFVENREVFTWKCNDSWSAALWIRGPAIIEMSQNTLYRHFEQITKQCEWYKIIICYVCNAHFHWLWRRQLGH